MAEWEIGARYGVAGVKESMFGPDRCSYCHNAEAKLIWTGVRDINGTRMTAHVHRFDEPMWGTGEDGERVEIHTHDEPGFPRLVAVVETVADAERIVAAVNQSGDAKGEVKDG